MIQWLVSLFLRPLNPIIVTLLGVYTVAWGIWVGNPWWTVYTKASVYHAMAAFAPEWFFGLEAVVVGLALLRGVRNSSHGALMLGGMLGGVHWGSIALLYLAGDWQSTGWMTASFISLYSLVIYLKAAVDRFVVRRGLVRDDSEAGAGV